MRGGGGAEWLSGAGLCTLHPPVTPAFPLPPGTVILELSKEKPNERLLDRHASQFAASVQKVESELSGQIRYLTQVGGRTSGSPTHPVQPLPPGHPKVVWGALEAFSGRGAPLLPQHLHPRLLGRASALDPIAF